MGASSCCAAKTNLTSLPNPPSPTQSLTDLSPPKKIKKIKSKTENKANPRKKWSFTWFLNYTVYWFYSLNAELHNSHKSDVYELNTVFVSERIIKPKFMQKLVWKINMNISH